MNYAMACGVPAIAFDRVECRSERVKNNVIKMAFPFGDLGPLAKLGVTEYAVDASGAPAVSAIRYVMPQEGR
jgi:hypothetical protein